MRRCARSGGNISLSVSKRFPLRKKQAQNNLFRPCLIFGLTCAVLQVRLKDLLGEGKSNAKASCTGLGLADNGGSGAGGAAIGSRNRCSSGAGRGGGRTERATICGGVLLQGKMGSRRRIPGALQEKPLYGSEKRDRAGPHVEGKHGGTALSRDGRRPLGLPGDHRLQERRDWQRQFRQRPADQAALSGSGNVQERRAAAIRNSRRSLGFAHQRRRPRHALKNRLVERSEARSGTGVRREVRGTGLALRSVDNAASNFFFRRRFS